jgi:hypothetical protein
LVWFGLHGLGSGCLGLFQMFGSESWFVLRFDFNFQARASAGTLAGMHFLDDGRLLSSLFGLKQL